MAVITSKRVDEDLYDEHAGYDDDTGVKLTPGLSAEERKQASTLYYLFNELWGLCLVKGDPGAGKDTFGNWLSYTLKRYFPHKKVWRDEKPRRSYGEYAGLFSDMVLADELAKMRLAAKGAVDSDDALQTAADNWVTSAGEVMLKNCILYLTEFYRYCYNRDPHNPMNKTMGGIHKMKRHLDALIIGTIQLPSELDKKTCLPWVDWLVTCTRSKINFSGFTFFVEKVKYDRRMDVLVPVSKPFAIPLDAAKPRSHIGDGLITVRKPKYRPESEEERIVLDVLKAGANNYEQIVEFLEEEGDMLEQETLATLKGLRFGKHHGQLKYVIAYNCYWTIYNSKSAPQLKTSLRGSE